MRLTQHRATRSEKPVKGRLGREGGSEAACSSGANGGNHLVSCSNIGTSGDESRDDLHVAIFHVAILHGQVERRVIILRVA